MDAICRSRLFKMIGSVRRFQICVMSSTVRGTLWTLMRVPPLLLDSSDPHHPNQKPTSTQVQCLQKLVSESWSNTWLWKHPVNTWIQMTKTIGIASQSVICSATFVTKPVKAGTPKVLGIIGMTLLQKRRCWQKIHGRNHFNPLNG